MRSNFKRLAQLCLALGGMSIAFSACSSKDKEEIILNSTGTTLSVRVAGIAFASEIALKGSSKGRVANDLSQAVIAEEKMISFDGFDAMVSMEKQSDPESETITKGTAGAGPAALASMASTTGMASGIQYRLLIYDAADVDHTGAPIANVVLTSGASNTAPIEIDANKTYNWYAFSTNAAGNVPDVKNGLVNKEELKNKDVLWANGSFKSNSGSNNLAITFKRNTTRIQVEINSLGAFGTIEGAPQMDLMAGTSSILKHGDLNIFDGEYNNVTSYTASTAVVKPTNYTVYGYSLYTIDNTTKVEANALNLKLGGFRILKKDYGTVSNTNNNNNNSFVNYNASTAAIKNTSDITFLRGTTYKIPVKLVESAVNVAGVKWGRSNLKAFDTRINGYFYPFSFMADPLNNVDRNQAVGTYYFPSINHDVCRDVYPKGTWRMPTKEEFNKLRALIGEQVFSPNTRPNVNPVGMGNGFLALQYADANTVINTGYPKHAQKLTIPLAGYNNLEPNDNGRQSGYNITLNIPKGPMISGYWTIDNLATWPAGNGAQQFYTSGDYTYTGGGNGPAILWGENNFMRVPESIRCVRN